IPIGRSGENRRLTPSACLRRFAQVVARSLPACTLVQYPSSISAIFISNWGSIPYTRDGLPRVHTGDHATQSAPPNTDTLAAATASRPALPDREPFAWVSLRRRVRIFPARLLRER